MTRTRPEGSWTLFCATSIVTPRSRSVEPSSMAQARWKLLFPAAVESLRSLSSARVDRTPQWRSSLPMSVLLPASTWPMTTMLSVSDVRSSSASSTSDALSSSRPVSRSEFGFGLGERRLVREQEREMGVSKDFTGVTRVPETLSLAAGVSSPRCAAPLSSVSVRVGDDLRSRKGAEKRLTGLGTAGEGPVRPGGGGKDAFLCASWLALSAATLRLLTSAKISSRAAAWSSSLRRMMSSTSASDSRVERISPTFRSSSTSTLAPRNAPRLLMDAAPRMGALSPSASAVSGSYSS
eukprot:scaffold1726_cov260-Pinguiococcus_pyrenoidosus.AAC.14